MNDTYAPIPGSDKEFQLAPTSTTRMDELDRLKLRAPCVGEQEREDVATNYGFDSVEDALEGLGYERPDDILPPHAFWKEAALVVIEGLSEEQVEEGADFAAARRAVADFSWAGNEQFAELMNGLSDFANSSGE